MNTNSEHHQSPENQGLVLGRYKILKEIGHGASGLVYLAQDQEKDQHVAIKELVVSTHIRGKKKEELIQRFYREIDITASLNHENIVRVFHHGQEDDKHYMVMEYLPGKTLADYIESAYSFRFDELLDIFIQFTQALAYAHDCNIIHRDIKPENIKVLTNQQVKIMDFGMARLEEGPSTLTAEGTMLGTIAYIAPEQIQDSKSVTHLADIFSLGVMLYQALTLQLPFKGDTTGQMILSILSEQPASIHALNPGIPEALEALVYRCLKKVPSQRIPSAHDILKALIDCRTQLPHPSDKVYPEASPSHQDKSADIPASSLRLLHIEDDMVSQSIYKAVLSKHKVSVAYTSVSSVAAAKKILTEGVFDAVICDYFLPDGTAMEIVDDITNIPSVMTTSMVEPQTIIELMKRGVLDYIVKTTAIDDAKKAIQIIQSHLGF